MFYWHNMGVGVYYCTLFVFSAVLFFSLFVLFSLFPRTQDRFCLDRGVRGGSYVLLLFFFPFLHLANASRLLISLLS